MGRLRLAAIALALFALPAALQAGPMHRWDAYIRESSRRFAIPEAWIGRVIEAESGGRASIGGRPVRSSAGAMGLMQLMPGTWAEARDRLGLGPDPDDPRDNILAGAFYLRSMYDRFGYPGLFAAYHCGPGRYANYLAGRAPLPRRTIAYLGRVTGGPGQREAFGNPPARVFAISIGTAFRTDSGEPAPIAAGGDDLFVPLRATQSRNNN